MSITLFPLQQFPVEQSRAHLSPLLPYQQNEYSAFIELKNNFIQEVSHFSLISAIQCIARCVWGSLPAALHATSGRMSRMSELARHGYCKLQDKVRTMACSLSIDLPQEIHILSLGSCTAFGSSRSWKTAELFIASEFFVCQEDLPTYLNLEKLEKGCLSEEDWITLFELWLTREFMPERVSYGSSLDNERRRAELKIWLQLFRQPIEYEKAVCGAIVHELAHIHKWHALKLALISFAWQLLSIPLFFIPLLFKNYITQCVSWEFEFEADRLSMQWLSQDGLVRYIDTASKVYRLLHVRHPEVFDEKGDEKICFSHPPLTLRLNRLKKLRQEIQ